MSALKPNSKPGEYMWIFQKDEVLSTTGRYLMWVADFFFFSWSLTAASGKYFGFKGESRRLRGVNGRMMQVTLRRIMALEASLELLCKEQTAALVTKEIHD